jgi:hypothetical protein
MIGLSKSIMENVEARRKKYFNDPFEALIAK